MPGPLEGYISKKDPRRKKWERNQRRKSRESVAPPGPIGPVGTPEELREKTGGGKPKTRRRPKQSRPRKARRTTPPLAEPPRLPGFLGDAQEAVGEVVRDADRAVTRVAKTALDFIEADSQRSAQIASDPNSTAADRIAALAPPVGPSAGTKLGAGLKAAQQLERAGSRAAKVNKARKAGQAVKSPKKTAKKTAGKAKDKASNTRKKATRLKQKASQPGGKSQIAKDTAKATARGAGKVAKGAGSKAANSRALPLASSPVIADEAGLSGEAVDKGSALVKGAVTAPISDPEKYAATTGRGVLGMGAAFGLGAYALGNTVVRGARGGPLRPVPGVGADYSAGEVVEPVTELAKQEWEGTKEIGKKLLSGDQETVEQTFVDDLGGIMFIPGPAIARKIKGSDTYKGARSKARDKASEKVRRQRREDSEAEARGQGTMPKADRKGRDKPRKKPRSAVIDPVTGEEYLLSNAPVVRSVGGRAVAKKIKRRNIRKAVSRTSDMKTQIAARETVLDDKDVQADIMGISGGPRTNRNAWLSEAERAAFVVANRGIPFNRDGALGWIDEIEASKTPDTREVGGVRESRVLDWIRDNPEVLSDPSFQSAVSRMTGILDEGTTSQRAKFLPVAKVAGIKTPEERLADGVEVGGRVIKETVTKPDSWVVKEAELKELRADARAAEARGDFDTALELRAKAKALARRISDYRIAYKKAGKDFIAETEAFIAERGLRTPARLTDREQEVTTAAEKFGNAAFGRRRRTSRATQKSEGKLLAKDTADRSREGVWNESVLGPRLQRTFHALTKGVIAEFGYKITIPGRGGKPRQVLEGTSREHQAALNRGELPDDVMLIDAQYYRAATNDKNADMTSFNDFLAAVAGNQGRLDSPRFRRGSGSDADADMPPVMTAAELRRLSRKDRAAEPGKKYIAVDREAMLELVGQIEGIQGGLARQASRLNRGTSNVILGLNPSFIGAQQIAEGGPAVTAAMTANPVALARMAKTAPNRKRGTNRQRAQREAMYGIAGGTYQFRPQSRGSVIDRVDQLTEPRLTKPSKALGLLKDAFKGRAVNQAVLRTGASWRRLAGLSEIDRRSKRTVGSLGGLVTRFSSLERKFKGRSLAEVEDYMAANPKLRNEIRAYMDDVMGNFSTLTRLEARFAPGIAFYPYLRYSLKWGFFSFPRRHPMRASILYFLGQVNAEELEKLVDNGTIADWIDNSFPVASKDGEPYVLPGGSRFAPSGSGVFQSLPFIGEGDPDKAIGSLNPGIALILNSVLGRDSFDGDKVAEEWWERMLLGAASLQAMVAPLRALDESDENIPGIGDVDPITGIKPRRTRDGIVVGEPSVSGQEFDALDPNRIERGLAPWGPLIGQSAKDYRKTNRKARKMKRGDYSSTSSSSSSSGPFKSSSPFDSGGPFKSSSPFK